MGQWQRIGVLVLVAVFASTKAMAQSSGGVEVVSPSPTPSLAASQLMPSDPVGQPPARRASFVMPSLYVATVLTQALDAHSTFAAIDAGAREGNPLIGRLAHSRPGFIALKAAIASSAIWLGRDLAKSRKKRAVLALIALNAGYAALAVHNYRTADSMRRR